MLVGSPCSSFAYACLVVAAAYLLFMPFALLRRSWIQFGGLMIAGLVQVMVFLFSNGDSAGAGIADNRVIQWLDIAALPIF